MHSGVTHRVVAGLTSDSDLVAFGYHSELDCEIRVNSLL